MTSLIRFVVLVTSLALVGCGSSDRPIADSPTAPTPPTGSPAVRVFGRVIDFATNTPVPHATIDFYTPPLPVIASSVVTDTRGFYETSLTRGVRYNPRINGPDVDSNRGTILPVAKQTEADYLVNGGTCIVFYGTIRDAITGEPVSGATITFFGVSQSGNDGDYRRDIGCPTPANPWRAFGTTFLTVSKDGYVRQQPYGTRAEFLPGAKLQRIDVALTPAE